MSKKHTILITTIAILSLLFMVSLFKNLAYPLLWNDEAETVMYSTRVMKYGYPEFDDGKNVLVKYGYPATTLKMEQRHKVLFGAIQGQMYLCAAGVLVARYVSDLYLKTAIVRLPFAMLGFFSLIIFAISVAGVFRRDVTQKLYFYIAFAFFELISVALVLHLREVRYYSMVLFFTAAVFYVYFQYRLFKKVSVLKYVIFIIPLLLFLFSSLATVYFIMVASIGLFEIILLLMERDLKRFVQSIAPALLPLVLIIPILVFLDAAYVAKEILRVSTQSLPTWQHQIMTVLTFFRKRELIELAIAVKVIMLGLLFYCRRKDKSLGLEREEGKATKEKLWISCFLTVFFAVYMVAIIRMPSPVIYQRYFIVLQPVLIVMMILDAFIVFNLTTRVGASDAKNLFLSFITLLLCAIFVKYVPMKFDSVKNHIYELTHRYRGPLDYVIPYIKSNFSDPESLIVATNYEECAYMYYLKSKVIIGYVGCNLKDDVKLTPDIIIYRKRRSFVDPKVFDELFKKATYKKISFPILDYLVNNIPELSNEPGTLKHLFRTATVDSKDRMALDIFIKEKE